MEEWKSKDRNGKTEGTENGKIKNNQQWQIKDQKKRTADARGWTQMVVNQFVGVRGDPDYGGYEMVLPGHPRGDGRAVSGIHWGYRGRGGGGKGKRRENSKRKDERDGKRKNIRR